MKVKVTSLLGNKPKTVVNTFPMVSLQDVDKLLRAVVTDRTATVTRADGQETTIVHIGCIRTEVFNQKQLLLDWAQGLVDEFPQGGAYATSSI